jgi:hypothetical protein
MGGPAAWALGLQLLILETSPVTKWRREPLTGKDPLVAWIDLAHDRHERRAVVNVAMNLWVL